MLEIGNIIPFVIHLKTSTKSFSYLLILKKSFPYLASTILIEEGRDKMSSNKISLIAFLLIRDVMGEMFLIF